MNRKIVNFFKKIIRLQRFFINPRRVFLVADAISADQKAEIVRRLAFYCPKAALEQSSHLRAYFSQSPVLFFGTPHVMGSTTDRFRYGMFNIDFRLNPTDGWDWSGLSGVCRKKDPDTGHSHRVFAERVNQLQKENFSKCYCFGTGPSLGRAIDHDWSDGYRIVCNTIVKNQQLWDHINPHFVVAGDAIYHFGHTEHAHQFRKDLISRLSDSETFFIYPDLFDPIVQRELAPCADKLIPIPFNYEKKRVHADLRKDFHLPGLGNVLPLLLLPVGCTLSREIYLWGFDGRAPNDQLFWSNSQTESYPDLLNSLKEAHPAFFDHFVPRDDPFKYVQSVHGDILDECLNEAEQEGFRFVMMHHSWTPTLKKRERSTSP